MMQEDTQNKHFTVICENSENRIPQVSSAPGYEEIVQDVPKK